MTLWYGTAFCWFVIFIMLAGISLDRCDDDREMFRDVTVFLFVVILAYLLADDCRQFLSHSGNCIG